MMLYHLIFATLLRYINLDKATTPMYSLAAPSDYPGRVCPFVENEVFVGGLQRERLPTVLEDPASSKGRLRTMMICTESVS